MGQDPRQVKVGDKKEKVGYFFWHCFAFFQTMFSSMQKKKGVSATLTCTFKQNIDTIVYISRWFQDDFRCLTVPSKGSRAAPP